MSVNVRFYGLHLIDSFIKFKWNTVSDTVKTEVKELVVSLIAGGTGDSKVESQMIKEKACKLMVDVAVREWPQKWPGLLPFVDSLMGSADSRKIELAFIFLRLLIEEVHFFSEDWESSRKSDLKSSLQSYMKANIGSLLSKNDELDVNSNLDESFWKLLTSAADFCPASVILSQNIIGFCCENLMKTNRSYSADCLLVVVSKYFKVQCSKEVQPLIDTCGLLLQNLQASVSIDPEFFWKLCKVFTTFSLTKICQKKSPFIPNVGFQHILDVHLLFLKSANFEIASMGSEFWISACNIDEISCLPAFLMCLNSLVDRCADIFSSDSLREMFSDEPIEDDSEDFESNSKSIKIQIEKLFKAISKIQPNELMTYLIEKINQRPEKMEKWFQLMEMVVASISKASMTEPLHSTLLQVFSSCMALQSTNSDLQVIRIRLLVDISIACSIEISQILEVIRLIFESFETNPNSFGKLLVQLVEDRKSDLVSYYGTFMETIGNMFYSTAKESAKIHLIDVLVILACEFKQVNEWENAILPFISQLFKNWIEFCSSPSIAEFKSRLLDRSQRNIQSDLSILATIISRVSEEQKAYLPVLFSHSEDLIECTFVFARRFLQLWIDEFQDTDSHNRMLILNAVMPLFGLLDQFTKFGSQFYSNIAYQTHTLEVFRLSINISDSILKQVLSTFALGLTSRCTMESIDAWFQKIISPFILAIFDRISLLWQEYQALDSVTADPTVMEKMQNTVRGLSDSYTYFLCSTISSVILSTAKHKDPVTLAVSEKLIGTSLNISAFLKCINGSLAWRHSHSCNRAILTLDKLLPFLLPHAQYNPFYAQDVLTGYLNVLHDPYHKENYPIVIAAISEIFIVYPELSFQTLRNFVPESNLIQYRNDVVQADIKTRKQLTEQLLKSLMGLKLSELYKVESASVLAIPQKLFMKKLKAKIDSTDIEIGSLFE